MQEVHFTPTDGRYLKLKAVRMVKEGEAIGFDKCAIQ